ncbi:MAG: DUF3772 domain-containing protein [Siculibacillus sp.]|nr:DUF3772 domain-containing protein [Siculibacillus sp.]
MIRPTVRALLLLALISVAPGPAFAAATPARAEGATKSQPVAAPAPAAAPAPTAATTATTAKPAPKPDEVQQKLDAWKVEVEQIAAGIQRDGQTDKHLAELRERAERIRAEAAELIAAESPRHGSIEARLKQLGPAPQVKENEPQVVESDAVKTERDEQQKLLAEVQGRIKQAQLVDLRAEEIIKTISDRRRDRFARELVERSRSVFDPGLWFEAVASLPGTFNSIRYLTADWVSLLASRGLETALAVGSVISILVVLLFAMRRRLTLFTDRDPEVADPPRLRKAAVAVGIVALNVAVPVVGLSGVARALDLFELNPERVSLSFDALIVGVGAAAAVYGVALALFAPAKPHWRVAVVGDVTATRIVGLSVLLAVTHGLGVTVSRLMHVVAAPVAEVIAYAGFFSMVDAVLIMMALKAAARSLTGDEAQPATGAGERSVLWRWIVPFGWILAIAAAAAAIGGWIALASFLTTQMVRMGFLLGALYILLQLADEAILATFQDRTRIGVMLTRSMGLGRERVEQIGVVLSGVVRILLIALTVLFALTPIGVSSQDVFSDAKSAFFGFKIGGFTFSLSAILTAIAFLVLGIAVTRAIQGWLDDRFLPRTRLDVGLKNSIRTAFGYVGYVLAAMLAFSVVGLDLKNVAIVAGALSVGIGFGLQSIVNNFVSGLILLAERPIKAGDLVEIGSEKGFVRKINVRSTEIETFDRASLIVPNSSLISGNVKNWMHRDLTGRCVVDVGVAYGAVPEKVREVLLACAAAHPKVLSFPAPAAFFVNFGDNALEFRLVCTVGNVTDAFGVESDLRFAIVEKLAETGIDIPYAQRDIHIRQLDDLRGLMDGLLGGARAPAPKPSGGDV